MQRHADLPQPDDRERQHRDPPGDAREPYVAPALERLGSWSTLTLQQSVGISGFTSAYMNPDLWWLYDER